MLAHAAGAEARDQGQAAGFVLGVQLRHQDLQIVRSRGRPAFQADGVLNPAGEFYVRPIGLAGAVANPDHMPRPRNPLTRGGIETAKRFFIFQQQGFVAGVEIHA